MYTKIKKFLVSFSFKPFSTLFWGQSPSIQPEGPKGRRVRSSEKNAFLIPFVSNVKMERQWHDLSFLMYFQVCLCKLIFTLSILHCISCLHYLGNKVKEKIKEKVIFLSMLSFVFQQKNIILIYLGTFFSVPAKRCAFLRNKENMDRFAAFIFLLNFLSLGGRK